jgi:hypothetical protein
LWLLLLVCVVQLALAQQFQQCTYTDPSTGIANKPIFDTSLCFLPSNMWSTWSLPPFFHSVSIIIINIRTPG